MTLALASLALIVPTSDAASFSVPPSSASVEPSSFVMEPLSTLVQDEETSRFYLALGGGLTSTEDSQGLDDDLSFDEGWSAHAAFGRHFGQIRGGKLGWGLELEALYSDQDIDATGTTTARSEVSLLGGYVNALLEFPFSSFVGIYVAGGLGAAAIDVEDFSDDLSDFSEEDGPFFSWQAKAGLRLWTESGVSLNLGYRFVNVDDAELDDGGGAEFDLETTQHIVELGLRFAL